MSYAVIFDMDGVISDTQKLHAAVESELLGRYGVHVSPEEVTYRYAGVKTSEFFSDLLKDTDADISALMKEKWERAVELAEERVDPIPGAIELIHALHEKNIPIGVSSASARPYVEMVLTKLGVRQFILQSTTGDEVEHGKPDPMIFVNTAKKLGIDPQACLVIEDGKSGMIAAKRGGMACIGLVYDVEEYPADTLVSDLRDVTLSMIEELVSNNVVEK